VPLTNRHTRMRKTLSSIVRIARTWSEAVDARCLSGPGFRDPGRADSSTVRREPSSEDDDEMESKGSQLLFSPSDLGNFTACEHLTQLELAVALGERTRPSGENAFAAPARPGVAGRSSGANGRLHPRAPPGGSPDHSRRSGPLSRAQLLRPPILIPLPHRGRGQGEGAKIADDGDSKWVKTTALGNGLVGLLTP
jgi:hypothetical protein